MTRSIWFALIFCASSLASTSSAQREAGTEGGQDPASDTSSGETASEEQWPSAVNPEQTEVSEAEQPSSSAETTSPEQEQWPTAVSIEYVEAKQTKQKPKGPYSKQVQGKLWLEGFVGPSSFDPDRFGAGDFNVDLGAPRVKGPEFGAALGGALAGQTFFLGASYRQANYEFGEGLGGYKLMKVGVDMQGVFRMVPYVHPLIRVGAGYARVFGGSFSALDVKTNGLYFTLGVGVRVPLVRWLSFVATFDWSNVTIYPEGRGFNTDGSQLGGTFGLTLHFIGV